MARGKSSQPPHIRIVESSATELRLAEARAFVSAQIASGSDVHVVGASRGAADDLSRSIAAATGATIGLHRFSLTQLAARLASPSLAADGSRRRPGSDPRRSRRARRSRRSRTARSRTSSRSRRRPASRAHSPARCRNCGSPKCGRRRLRGLPLGGPDLAALLERFEAQFAAATRAIAPRCSPPRPESWPTGRPPASTCARRSCCSTFRSTRRRVRIRRAR